MAEGEDGVVRIGKRVFVGNLAWKTSWQDLKDKFRDCGNVVYANVMKEEGGRSKGWGIVEYENPEEALAAINTQNGTDLAGRRILVREDREDRDVKQYAPEDGSPAPVKAPRAARPPREPREPRRDGAGRSEGSGRGGRGGRGAGGRGRARAPAPERTGESSGLQVVVQGIPWSYTWQDLKDLFTDIDNIEHADIAMGNDGRSRGFGTVKFTDAESAQAAIAKWHDQELEGRRLAVFLDKFA
ncbi:hypothetical protein CEUSTIGMA_g9771.t1 [Chlamydomonas eustigma]|uniref:RRM domain-containing protein n=1 Tax=Chlamydomonas eustigma TaxID=1157962 RepID=A0A250XHE3_9CHLO|nr:hypothetical protein CEUSTIGMA_g9771.t1 [Chlamydomonas eustigma]|eukprot:GAX82342.1 hypothetical protein CEUSTIGMA_g9771.t1 [Chlamydomonas eustigma]